MRVVNSSGFGHELWLVDLPQEENCGWNTKSATSDADPEVLIEFFFYILEADETDDWDKDSSRILARVPVVD